LVGQTKAFISRKMARVIVNKIGETNRLLPDFSKLNMLHCTSINSQLSTKNYL